MIFLLAAGTGTVVLALIELGAWWDRKGGKV